MARSSDATAAAPPGKRERLIRSAANLVYRQGIPATTLAQVAADADVPLGNVYYYFKTRDDLIAAVVESRQNEIVELLERLNTRAEPLDRLRGLAESWTDVADQVTLYGCPIGGLTAELCKHAGPDADGRRVLFETLIDWVTDQFAELGDAEPRERAQSLIARIQGTALLACAFNDRQLLDREFRRIANDLSSAGS